jgi:SAM-dependent methyltransferase
MQGESYSIFEKNSHLRPEKQDKEWFEGWFDTEYYHLLYSNRDDAEARNFILALLARLQIAKGSKVADIACGKGRHSRVLAEAGMQVWGYDLSENSIDFAHAQKIPGAHFIRHDIRDPYAESGFDCAMNLFTSFGYFEDAADDKKCIENIFHMLKPGGIFVQDYLNAAPFLSCLPFAEEKILNGIAFNIQKKYEPPFIRKCIDVLDGDAHKTFYEKVKTYSEPQLRRLHEDAGFVMFPVFGNYSMEPYEPAASPRIILISQKP